MGLIGLVSVEFPIHATQTSPQDAQLFPKQNAVKMCLFRFMKKKNVHRPTGMDAGSEEIP